MYIGTPQGIGSQGWMTAYLERQKDIIYIEHDKLQAIKELAQEIAKKKLTEAGHRYDNRKETTRNITGLMGEAAMEQVLGIDIIEWSVGDTIDYAHPDILRYGVGVKTVQHGKHHVIAKRSWYPQILCTVMSDTQVQVNGLATPHMLNSFQDDRYILDPRLRAKGTKTCYTGYDKLINIRSRADLEKVLEKLD